jgi:hypothetical protein
MEIIQHMALDGSPLAILTQQRAKAMNLIVVEKSVGVPRKEPSDGHNDRARHTRSEAASSASPNRHLVENDACWHITQNRNVREYDHDRDDLRNVIEDQRCLRVRMPSPPRRSRARDITQLGGADFTLWWDRLEKSGGQPSSRWVTLISMMDPAILKKLFRFIRTS